MLGQFTESCRTLEGANRNQCRDSLQSLVGPLKELTGINVGTVYRVLIWPPRPVVCSRFPDLNESTREITGAVALEPQPSAPEFAPLNFPMRSVEQRMAVLSDVEANQYTLKSCVETMTAVTNLSNRLQSRANEVQQLNSQLALLQRMYKDARAEISVLKAENKELKRKATVMFRFGGPSYSAVEEQGVVNVLGGLGSTAATPARTAQDGGKKKRPAAEERSSGFAARTGRRRVRRRSRRCRGGCWWRRIPPRRRGVDGLANDVEAESPVAAVQAAAEVILPTAMTQVTGEWKEEVAVIKIQTAFRGYMARRALRALRGLVRLKSVVQGTPVIRRTSNALRCMQTLARVQSQIQSRRIRMSEENQALQRQLLQKRAKELSLQERNGMTVYNQKNRLKQTYLASMRQPSEEREHWLILSLIR
ncbi:hypothetical protein TEA_004908 [Camellia sinensis var. sinensis]|uniref:DUF4005 domain-containing protein n=1 Tax=Camellia sinensis var. sinensis TaxID=542762 RepID=A0A4S4EMS0_CAMSN|nr:hypothetical protein TEA_004908 [Camellia sinensis var. sinensis]